MKTYINVILDKSGSMYGVVTDTIGGFNKWLEEQQKAKGEQSLTLTMFDTVITKPYVNQDIGLVAPLTTKTYIPGGNTALLDAIGKTIGEVDPKAKKVLFVIITDGQENSSHEYKRADIKSLIEAKEKAGWTFAYIGATQEGFDEAGAIGINLRSSYTPSGSGTQAAFVSMSGSTMAYTRATDPASATAAVAADWHTVIPDPGDQKTAPVHRPRARASTPKK